MKFIIRVVINAFALWVVSLIPALTVTITPYAAGNLPFAVTLVAVGAVFALVNSIIGTVIRIVAFPVYILTLGLISFVVNGFLLWTTAWITGFWGWGLSIGAFWWGVVAAIIISLINWFFGILLRPQKKARRRP